MYETLPYIFASMGVEAPVLGYVVTLIFFLAILMAALTSSISLLDVCIEHAVEQYHIKRWQSVLLFLVLGLALGIPCALSFGILGDVQLGGKTIFDICDYVSSNVLMTLGRSTFNVLYFLIRWIIPLVILAIFVSNLIG